jgi:hypothetical protein
VAGLSIWLPVGAAGERGAVIVREYQGETLMDVSSLARLTGRQRATIRARATQIACDVRTRRGLYDALDTIQAMAEVRPRTRRAVAA